MPEAVALDRYYKYLEREKQMFDPAYLGNLTSAYISAGIQRVFDDPAVKDRLPAVLWLFAGTQATANLDSSPGVPC